MRRYARPGRGARRRVRHHFAVERAPPRPPAPSRKYQRGDRVTPVVEEPGSYQEVALSPNGLLVAMMRHDQKAVRLVDTDRKRVVGRAPGLQSGSGDRLT
ncbi:MAG: hypothetical protein JNL21_11930 [Myxococcales bacterium]|nr:hypothetical protein [Myxococcales bacterium]